MHFIRLLSYYNLKKSLINLNFFVLFTLFYANIRNENENCLFITFIPNPNQIRDEDFELLNNLKLEKQFSQELCLIMNESRLFINSINLCMNA
jgi:hypothetical protein